MPQPQDALFDIDTIPVPEDAGLRGPMASKIAGVSYRQLDYWARTGLVKPSLRAAKGSGSQRLYGFRDIVLLRTVKRLLEAGIALQSIRTAIDWLRDQGIEDLAGVTLMSDGASVYACTSKDEVFDLLAGGQGVFGIALSTVTGETATALTGVEVEYPTPAVEVTDQAAAAARSQLRAVS
jgi:DNA-binding transcriptional MerR regulator